MKNKTDLVLRQEFKPRTLLKLAVHTIVISNGGIFGILARGSTLSQIQMC